ncbi:hypothetical protein AB6A40_007330 [Gnathostoma spinigerum]|uniref:Uncharacterized protein n=1 Tax=Gnathostoma spinigerum TaxID=75299 RepID=A0ABD6ET39_9BILA
MHRKYEKVVMKMLNNTRRNRKIFRDVRLIYELCDVHDPAVQPTVDSDIKFNKDSQLFTNLGMDGVFDKDLVTLVNGTERIRSYGMCPASLTLSLILLAQSFHKYST